MSSQLLAILVIFLVVFVFDIIRSDRTRFTDKLILWLTLLVGIVTLYLLVIAFPIILLIIITTIVCVGACVAFISAPLYYILKYREWKKLK
jgi:hypothetical protein